MTARSTSPHSHLKVTAGQLGLLLFAVYYTFIGGQTAQGIYDHVWRYRTLALTSGLIGLWLARRLWSRGDIPRTPLDWPLFFLLGSWLVAAIFSQSTIYSGETLVFWITYLCFFYMAVDLGRYPPFREMALNALIGASGFILMFATLQIWWWMQEQAAIPPLLQAGQPGNLPRLTVLGNPNTMAAFLTPIVPLALYKLTTATRLIFRLLLVSWLILLVGAIWLTDSDGGWLGLAVGLGLWSMIWLARRGRLTLTHSRLISAAIVMLALLAAVVGAAIIFEGHTESITTRQQVMHGAWEIWRTHPLVGTGPGTFAQELVELQRPAAVVWPDAHNIFLTLLAETGLLGAIGLGWLVAINLKLLWDTLLHCPPATWPLASLACAAALAGFVTHNMVDSMLKYPAVMLPVVIIAGFWISPFAATGRKSSWGRTATLAALVGLTGLTIIGFRGIRNIETYNAAVAAADRGDWASAVTRLRAALQQTDLPFYHRQLGLAAGYLAHTNPAYRPEAIAAYQSALARLEMMPNDHANLACLLWTDNQPEAAIAQMTLANQREPGNFDYGFNLARYKELSDGPAAAHADYVDLLTRFPTNLPSPFWQSRPEVVTATLKNLAGSPTMLIEYYLSRGEVAAARQQLEAIAPDGLDPFTAQLTQGKTLLAEGRFEAAATALEAARQIDPRQADPYLNLSRLALAQNKLTEAGDRAESALYLRRDADTLYQAGQVAQAAGRADTALQLYGQAFDRLTATASVERTRYETEAARRRPLPEQQLPCLLRLYPDQLAEIALTEGGLRESQGDVAGAAAVYRRLLQYMPEEPVIAEKLAALCAAHPQECEQ